MALAAASAQEKPAAGRNAGQALKINLDESLPDRLVPVLTALDFHAQRGGHAVTPQAFGARLTTAEFR